MPTLKAHIGFKGNLFKVAPDASEGVNSQTNEFALLMNLYHSNPKPTTKTTRMQKFNKILSIF